MKKALLSILLLASTPAMTQTIWYDVAVPTDKKLNTIVFASSTIGYIGGNDSLLMKTTDGGQTWEHLNYTGVTFMPGGEHVVNLQFISEMVGYMALGPYTGVYKTTDGGQSWTQEATTGNLCFNQGLYFFDASNGFAGGAGCFQGERINRLSGGAWTEADMNFENFDAADLVVDIHFRNANMGLAASRGGRILRTTNGGLNWDPIPSPAGDTVPLTAVLWVDDTLCYAAYAAGGQGFGLLISEDAGATWEIDMNSATFYYPDFNTLHQTTEGRLYTAGKPGWADTGIIFEEDAAGVIGWSFYDVEDPVNDIASHTGGIVFAVGDTGMVVVNVPPGNIGLPALDQMEELVVFPNPAGDLLNVSLSGPKTLYSMGGQIIRSYDENEQILSLQGIAPGLYVLQIESTEGIRRTSIFHQ